MPLPYDLDYDLLASDELAAAAEADNAADQKAHLNQAAVYAHQSELASRPTPLMCWSTGTDFGSDPGTSAKNGVGVGIGLRLSGSI